MAPDTSDEVDSAHPPVDAPQTTLSHNIPRVPPRSEGPGAILLVDDDPITNYMNARLLRSLRATAHIEVTTNGQEALAFLRSQSGQTIHRPQLILLDINMPVLDGFEFLDEYWKPRFEGEPADAESLPTLCVLTTSTSPTDSDRIKHYPGVHTLIKPLTLEALTPMLERAGLR
jgi:CheY-like chemotaxis protein